MCRIKQGSVINTLDVPFHFLQIVDLSDKHKLGLSTKCWYDRLDMNPQNYTSTPQSRQFNKKIVILVVLIIAVIVVLVGAFSTKSKLSSSLNEYSDDQISVQYPKSLTPITGVTEVKFNAAEPSKDTFSAKRYAKIKATLTPDSLKQLLQNPGDDVTQTTIQNRTVLEVGEAKSSDQLERSYYVFGPTHIWRVIFSYSDGSELSKNINNIIESFKIK